MARITVTDVAAAWEIAKYIMPVAVAKDDNRSKRAGYSIYYSVLQGTDAWVSDLGCRLECNLPDGRTININIEDRSSRDHSEVYPLVDTHNRQADAIAQLVSTLPLDKVFTAYPCSRAIIEHGEQLCQYLQSIGISCVFNPANAHVYIDKGGNNA